MNYLHLIRNITGGIKSTGRLTRENKATTGFKQKSCIVGVMSCKRVYCLLQREKSYLLKKPMHCNVFCLVVENLTPLIPRHISRHKYTSGVRTPQHHTTQQALPSDTTGITTQLQAPCPITASTLA